MPVELNEPVLDDKIMLHRGYFYIADGNLIEAALTCRVESMKIIKGYKTIQRCDLKGRVMNRDYAQLESAHA